MSFLSYGLCFTIELESEVAEFPHVSNMRTRPFVYGLPVAKYEIFSFRLSANSEMSF